MALLSLVFVDPVSKLTFIPKFSNHSEKEVKCCSAKISVGHNNAVCQSLDFPCNAAKAPTSVFPDPTSP